MLLRQQYSDTPSHELAVQFQRTVCQVYSEANSMGLKKSEEYLASPAGGRLQPSNDKGGKTRFKPGHQSWNKGISYRAGGRSAETRFKPGLRGSKWVPIGSERITRDGYSQRKISDTGNTPCDWVSRNRPMSDALNLALTITAADLFSGVMRKFENRITGAGGAARRVRKDYDTMATSVNRGIKSLAVGGYIVAKMRPGIAAAAALATYEKLDPVLTGKALIGIGTPFKIAASGYADLADQISRAASASTAEIAEAAKYAAGPLASMQRSSSEMLTLIALMAQQGVKGLMAGRTSF